MITDLCTSCHGMKPRHFSVTSSVCCKCHVEAGGTPADWHYLCMETYKKLTKDTK